MALMVVGLVSLGAHRATAGARIPDEIRARAFPVMGEAGKNEATLGATSDGFVALSFRDLQGTQRFAALMTPSGKVSLSWFQSTRARLDVGVTDAGEGEAFTVALRDPSGRVVWQPSTPNPY